MVPTPYLQGTLNNGVVGPSLYFRDNPTLINDLSNVSGTSSTGFQTYNALQTVLQKRISNGLEGQVAYTWSHCLTNNSGYYGTWGSATQATPASPYYQNLYDPHADYASCYFDSKNILAAYATYDLPIGKGKAIGNNMNPVVNAVVGNWQVSTIVSIHSGFPLAVYNATDTSGTNSRGPRPNCGRQQVFGRQPSFAGSFQGYQWMSPSGYSEPANRNFWQLPGTRTSGWTRLHRYRHRCVEELSFDRGQVLPVPRGLPERVQQCSVGPSQYQLPQFYVRVDQYLTTRKEHPIRL